MRRLTTLVLPLLAAFSLILAACGGNDDTTSAEAPDSDMDGTMGGGQGHGGAMGHDEMSAVAEGARRIKVTARSFQFDPAEITVTAGEEVAIALSSEDVLHDFSVDELDVHVAADADETAEGGLRADEPGRFTFYCTVDGHREAGMEGTLVVEAP